MTNKTLKQIKKLGAYTAVAILSAFVISACGKKEAATQASAKKQAVEIGIHDRRIADLQKAADAGKPEAQYFLARRYLHGTGVELDKKKAFELFEKSAYSDFAPAQYELGLLYEGLGGVKKGDMVTATSWYKKSADKGYAPAQYKMSNSYIKGYGVPRSFELSRAMLIKSAEQGYELALNRIIHAYENGFRGFPVSKEQAFQWHKKAAEQGVISSQYKVGIAYLKGSGTESDTAEAYKWLSLVTKSESEWEDAQNFGNAPKDMDIARIKKACTDMAGMLEPQALKEADKWIEEWEPENPEWREKFRVEDAVTIEKETTGDK